jgi:hypothetical protein
MNVIHILKDGSSPTDIAGHIVRLEDASPLYQLIHSINKKKTYVTKKNTDRKF